MKNIIKGLCIVVSIGWLAACSTIPADTKNPVAKNQVQNEDSTEQALAGKKIARMKRLNLQKMVQVG